MQLFSMFGVDIFLIGYFLCFEILLICNFLFMLKMSKNLNLYWGGTFF